MSKTARKRVLTDILVALAALFISLVIIFPIFYGIVSAFKSRAEFYDFMGAVLPQSFANLENFEYVFLHTPILRYMLNSLVMGLMGSVLRIAFAVLAAYAFAYYEFRGKKFFFYLIFGTMMLPADTLLLTNYYTVTHQLGWFLTNTPGTYFIMCVTSLVGASQMFMLRQNFKTIPRALHDAALMDGCGDLRYLTSVVLPLCRPILFTLIVQSFIGLWNAYLWPLIITANKTQMRTVQVGVVMLTDALSRDNGLVLAGVSILLIPSFILFAILRTQITKGITMGALVG